MSRGRIVFFGSPAFAVASLQALEQAGETPIAVVTQPDRPAGRGQVSTPPPVKVWAQARGIEVLQPERVGRKAFREAFAALEPEIAVVVAFGQILTQKVLDIPAHGFINIHGSLLPRYRGSAPVQWAVLNGDARTGVTIQRVVRQLDAGDVLLQAEVEIGPDETAGELFERLSVLGSSLLPEAIAGLRSGELPGTPQDPDQVTEVRKLTKEDGHVDWTRTAQQVHDWIRGVTPWPGAHAFWRDERVRIHRARVGTDDAPPAAPGTIRRPDSGGVCVAVADGWVQLLELQRGGRKRLCCRDFLMGCAMEDGDRLE